MSNHSYLDFELEIGPGQRQEYPIAVIRSPAGEAREIMHFPFRDLELENRLKTMRTALLRSGGKRRRVPLPEEQSVQNFGRALFDALLIGEIHSRYDASKREAARQGKGLRLKLRIQPPELAALPWEFLYDSRQAEYVCLSRNTPVVRYLELPGIIQPLSVTPPLRILGMVACPSDLPALDADVAREKQRVEEAIKDLRASGLVELTWLEGQTWRDLQRETRRGPWHIFHFIGHGDFDQNAGEGLIILTNEEGKSHRLTATELGRLLADHHSLRLVSLNSWEGARGSERDIFSSTAATLIRRGLPAVLAMQYEITDQATVEFANTFYRALADGMPVDAAVAEARKAVSLAVRNTLEWGTPVLYMRAPDGCIFDIKPITVEDRIRIVEEQRQITQAEFLAQISQSEQVERNAGWLEKCADVVAISNAHHGLAASEPADPTSALLRDFVRVSQDVEAALGQESTYNQRLALSAVEARLDSLLWELPRSSLRYAERFRPVTARWRQIIADYVHELAEAVELRQEIDSPYITGVPLTDQQKIFVGRTDIGAHIEGLLLDRRRPPLLLYGQRRMGKTSLLNNLGRLLPSTIVPLFVDLQGPVSQASDHAGFLYNIARGMAASAQRHRNLDLFPLTREVLAVDPFTRFDEWLDEVERTLGRATALLTLDEFEVLDSAIAKGRFDEEAVLGLLRHLIQHRPRFKVLLAGSHTLDELQRWASYLINVQVVHLSYLKEDEAHQLIERPVKDFALRYEPEASQRVVDLTRCHPYLVQLLCAEIVALKNEQPPAIRRLARLGDVEAAVPEALSHGNFFFADIQQDQVDAAGLALLRFVAAQGERVVVSREDLARQVPHDLDRMLNLLIRRELIEPAGDGYRFQVELIRRWFARKDK